MRPSDVEVTPLGGLGEFGKNSLVLRAGGHAIVVDAGISFPDETIPGIDRIAPDFSSLAAEEISGVFLTHGHEDHIGALAQLRAISDAPIFATQFTRSLARRRLLEAGLGAGPRDRLNTATFGNPVSTGPFSVTFLPVSHSVPQSAALLIEAFGLRVLHTGDFKLDDEGPPAERTNLEDFAARAGNCDLLVIDSTNAERPGGCPSEREAREGLRAAARGVAGRVLVTTFSSHVARMQAAADAAREAGREIAILGKSMREIAEIGESHRYLSIPPGLAANPDRLEDYLPSRLLLLCAGSQGEPHSALSRLAAGRHDKIAVGRGDLAVFSARTIPGRERAVARVVDGLLRRSVEILPRDPEEPPVHVSGHAYSEDIKRLIEAVRPRAVLPAHGERQALLACGALAREAGVPENEIFLCDNGDSVFLGEARRLVRRARPAGAIYLDAARGSEMAEAGIRDRRVLGVNGVVVVTVTATGAGFHVAVEGRGVAADSETLAGEVSSEVRSALERGAPHPRGNRDWVRSETELAAKRACRRAFGIRPMIVASVND